MKKNMLKIGSFAFLFSLGLTSCNSEAPTSPQSDAKVIDLNNFSFAEVQSILKAGTPVVLKDGESEIPVSRFTELQGEMADADGGKVTSYQANDSVSVSLASDFASIKVGNRLGYAAYSDAVDMQTVTKAYGEMLVATKAAPSTVTRSASGQSMRIDMYAARKANEVQTKNVTNAAMWSDMRTPTPEEKIAFESQSVNTKAGDYQFPRNKVVTVRLLISSGACKPIPHELVWQQENAQRSIKDVFSKDKASTPTLKFIVEQCAFKSTESPSEDLTNFADFVRSNGDKYPTGGCDIFVLVRQWGWGVLSCNALGASLCNVYNINRPINRLAYAMSNTTCLYPMTLAHELGHIFGADHTTTPWYRLNKDVMNAVQQTWVNEYHLSSVDQSTKNRDVIYKNLKQL